MKILALGDLHCRLDTTDLMQKLVGELGHNFDVMLLAGDLTNNGLVEEAEVLARQLTSFHVPVISILGNHDHEKGKAEQITTVMRQAGLIMLDGTAFEVGDLGVVGTKGFCGGFDENLIQPFGEAALKAFIRTSIDEALRLETHSPS